MLWVVLYKKSFGLAAVCFIFEEKVITILCLGTISRFFVHIEKEEKNFDLNISGPVSGCGSEKKKSVSIHGRKKKIRK